MSMYAEIYAAIYAEIGVVEWRFIWRFLYSCRNLCGFMVTFLKCLCGGLREIQAFMMRFMWIYMYL